MSGGGKNHARDDPSDVVTVSPERSVTSYRIDPLIARSFKESCQKTGQSTCHVLEAFMYGFSHAVGSGDYHEPRPMTVNLNVYRQVERVRRRGSERIYEEAPKDLGDPSSCFMCGGEAVYLGTLEKTKPRTPAYVCASCRGFLDDRKGFRVSKVKNYRRAWVDPYDHSL